MGEALGFCPPGRSCRTLQQLTLPRHPPEPHQESVTAILFGMPAWLAWQTLRKPLLKSVISCMENLIYGQFVLYTIESLCSQSGLVAVDCPGCLAVVWASSCRTFWQQLLATPQELQCQEVAAVARQPGPSTATHGCWEACKMTSGRSLRPGFDQGSVSSCGASADSVSLPPCRLPTRLGCAPNIST